MESPPPARALADWPLTIALTLLALTLRALDLGQFLTVDEGNFWIARSHAFLDALRAARFGDTAISSHPGVTTMWLGALGLLLTDALRQTGVEITFPLSLALLRLPAAIANTLCLLIGHRLLRRLLPPGTAALAAALWACDPFLVAYSRVLHVDALMGSFFSVSLLAGACAWLPGRQPSRRTIIGCGVAAGLAILTKSPALIVLPLLAALALWGARHGDAGHRRPFRQTAADLLRCGAALAATCLLLYPALWAAPLRALDAVRLGVEAEGAQPHMLGNFFLGRRDDAPGALFYPVALALRLTPLSMLGLGLLPLSLWRNGRRRELLAVLRLAALLAGAALLFTIAMSVFPKKFNRYLVPAFPALDILAAIGWWGAWRVCATWLAGWLGTRRARAGWLAGAALALAAALDAASWHPYEIAAFNQLLGGAQAGAATFVVGWGEGYEQAAAWLNAQPDIRGVASVTRLPVVQAPYMQRGALARTPDSGALPPDSGYIVVGVQQVQRGAPSPPFDAFYGRAAPLHTVTIHGVPYLWIYQVPPAVQVKMDASFAGGPQLYGVSRDGAARAGETIRYRLTWAARAPSRPLALFAHLIGPGGRAFGLDLPLANDGWQEGRYVPSELPVALPPDLAPGRYRLMVGVYDAASGERLDPGVSAADVALDGVGALLLDTIDVP